MALEHERASALKRRAQGRPAPAPAEAETPSPSFIDALVEAVTARVLAEVMPPLEQMKREVRVGLADLALRGQRRIRE